MEIRVAIIATLHNYDLISFLPRARFRFYLLRLFPSASKQNFAVPRLWLSIYIIIYLIGGLKYFLLLLLRLFHLFYLFYNERNGKQKKEERQRYIYSNLFLMSPFFVQPAKPRRRDELRGGKLNLWLWCVKTVMTWCCLRNDRKSFGLQRM